MKKDFIFTQVKNVFPSSCAPERKNNAPVDEKKQRFSNLLIENRRLDELVRDYQFLFNPLIARYQTANTTVNQHYLSEHINNIKTQEVILFATRGPLSDERNTFFESSQAPLLAAIIKIESEYILCDGLFLSVTQKQHISEVQRVLDDAQNSKKVSFCNVNVEFTSEMETLKAIVYLLKQAVNNKISFTAESRAQFFAQLSNFTEEEWKKL